MKILVTRFIPLKSDDLEAWSSDPEEWVNSEDKDNDQWEYELRVRFVNLCRRSSCEYAFIFTAMRGTCPADDGGSISKLRCTSTCDDVQPGRRYVFIMYFLVCSR